MTKTETNLDLTELLEYLDPGEMDYTEWLNVGFALKEAGYPCSVWDEWSRRDPGRYHAGEAFRKWDSFKGTSVPITAGTLVQMAKERGWSPAPAGHELDWGDAIGARDEQVVVKKGWVEEMEIREPETWNPAEQLLTYLDVLFNDDENVGYVTEVWDKDGRLLPTAGNFDRTAAQLKAELKRCNGDLGAVLGDPNPEAGAWIRFNPLDGKGVRNDNVTDLRFALVESDETELGQQNAILRELELPIAALVYSGGKSLHAIVHIDAPNYEEYRKRVEFLYEICRKNGLKPDKQNKNPSRLSRMPGITRKGHKQFLVEVNIGKRSWNEWREWIESVNDDLPEFQNISSVWGKRPTLAPELIPGILRKGRKMMIVGASKTGKSMLLSELAIAIAEGKEWLGRQCARGKVLYVNLEIPEDTFWNRLLDIYEKSGIEASDNLTVWNLRGYAMQMDKLTPRLVNRAKKLKPDVVIIDPIYKVITGDENSAEQMAKFCNEFDKLCTQLGASTIYVHHHSKGFQGQKRSMDRASGSGVFARDADALLDLTELAVGSVLAGTRVALRVEGTLREFAPFDPINIWFDYPLHVLDTEGILTDAKAESEIAPQEKGGEATKRKFEQERIKKNKKVMATYQKLSKKGPVRIGALAADLGLETRTARNWVDECPHLTRDGNGYIFENLSEEEES